MPIGFKLLTYPEILLAMINQVKANPNFSNMSTEPLSFMRTILEAAALQDAEQYVQIGKVLDSYNLDNCVGEVLDARAAEYGVRRVAAKQSFGTGVFVEQDPTILTIGFANQKFVSLVGLVLTVDDGAPFPLSGYVILTRENTFGNRERLHYTNRIGNQLAIDPFTPPAFPHAPGDSVILSTRVGTYGPYNDTLIPVSTVVYAARTDLTPETGFITLADTVMLDGDPQSAPVTIRSQQVGEETVVASGSITLVRGGPSNIGFNNTAPTYGGANRQSDAELRRAVRQKIQMLSRATPNAVQTSVLGLAMGNQRVLSAQIEEPVGPGVSYLYIDGGLSGSNPLDMGYIPRTSPVILVRRAEQFTRRGSFGEYPIQVGGEIGKVVMNSDLGVISPPVVLIAPNRWQVNILPGSGGGYALGQLGNAVPPVEGWYLKDDADEIFPILDCGPAFIVVGPSINSLLTPFGPYSIGPYAVFYDGKPRPLIHTGTTTAPGAGVLVDVGKTWHPSQFKMMVHPLPLGRVVWEVEVAGVVYDVIDNTATTLTIDPPALIPMGEAYVIRNKRAPLVGVDAEWLAQIGPPANTPVTPPPLAFPLDYIICYESGEIELTKTVFPLGMVENECILVWGDTDPTKMWPAWVVNPKQDAYNVATGLVQLAQRVVNGMLSATDVFPGFKACGSIVRIKAPAVQDQIFQIIIEAEFGYAETDLYPLVRNAVVRYINFLRIGEDVILAEVIRRCKSIRGVYNVKIIFPTSDPKILHGQLARVLDPNNIFIG